MDKEDIANKILKNYETPKMPEVEQVSGAFPIEGPTGEQIMRNKYVNRLLNSQEVHAFEELNMLRNFDATLKQLPLWLKNPKSVPYGIMPSHKMPKGNIDDAQYPAVYFKPNKMKGFYWDNIPKNFWNAMQKIQKNIRQVDKFKHSRDEPEIFKNYYEGLKQAVEFGTEYMDKIAEKPELYKDNLRFVKANTKDISKGDYIQGQFIPFLEDKVLNGKNSYTGRVTEVINPKEIYEMPCKGFRLEDVFVGGGEPIKDMGGVVCWTPLNNKGLRWKLINER